MSIEKNGGSAFPEPIAIGPAGDVYYSEHHGMTLRDYFAGQALANPLICDGRAKDYELDNWFGKDTTGIKTSQIVAAQADEYAIAMLAQREKG
ncbi:MAG: hypothetical protein COB78_09890 [Hyphomicrobiales bacterium]|nr:MAG: hypothetical protein COB78_09890 [Hyphomicrobiales bacterium]